MANPAVIAAVSARLAANWSATALAELNTTGDTPADASPFLAVEYPVANEEQKTIGTPGQNVFRETGVIRLVLNTPRGAGLSQALGWADVLKALFRAKQFGGVTTWAPSGPVVDDNNDQGNYFKVSVAVPYFYDLIG